MPRIPTPLWLVAVSLLLVTAPPVSHAGSGRGRLKRLAHAAKKSALGRAGERAGRAVKKAEQLLSGHLTLLADQIEKQLPAAEAAKFNQLRLANPLTAAGFVGGKIKADWNPLWMWAPASFALSTGIHYALVDQAGLGFWPAALIRVPAGLAVDLTVIGAYNHYQRKKANPEQSLRKTGRELKDEYLTHAAERRARNREVMGPTRENTTLSPRLVRFLQGRFPSPPQDDHNDSAN